MKTDNEILTKINGNHLQMAEFLGDSHLSGTVDTPLKRNAFVISDEEKQEIIRHHFAKILDTIGLDLTDDSLKGTPDRVAKMFVKEIFYGLNPKNKPQARVFDNNYEYRHMLVEKNIKVQSLCEHHFMPIVGKAHVAYFSNGSVIGLSKLNRIVDYYARRPQVQERLTRQIAEELKKVLGTDDVAVFIEARHMCVSFRGIQDHGSSTVTVEYSGRFKDEKIKNEFLQYIRHSLSAE